MAVVQNKSPATVQLTAEQIIRESQETKPFSPSKWTVTDSDEFGEYLLSSRTHFEDLLRRVPWNKAHWLKYASFEDSHNHYDRARSVFERALLLHYTDSAIWLKYSHFEMKNKFINHARNVWHRAVTLLPRIDQLWYKYIHMEEILGNVSLARSIFQKWMTWEPHEQAWLSYVKFERRYNEIHQARAIFQRLVHSHPTLTAWIRYTKFEVKNGDVARAKHCYQRALDTLEVGDEDGTRRLFEAFPQFQDKPMEPAQDATLSKMRIHYRDKATRNGLDYDHWFDYIRLEQTVGDLDLIRQVFNNAVANVPPADQKHFWQRYIYLWILYALFEELDAQDVDRTRHVYTTCLNLIPHHKFSFAKIWLLAAQFELRQLNLKAARLILGSAIGKAPKHKIFKEYIQIELQLRNIDRCRKLYHKYLEWSPQSCIAWRKYAEFETLLGETDRARAIFELAVVQPALDMPELIWKDYIDFEISNSEFQKTRLLYERLLRLSKHIKVWISYAKFEASSISDDDLSPPVGSLLQQKKQSIGRARSVFDRGINYFKTSTPDIKEDVCLLLEEWTNLEASFGELGNVKLIPVQPPKKLQILESAYKWKKQRTA